jgi:23S rRNA (uracil1939-C5)-methyltransferase
LQHELSARVIDAVRQYMIESGAAAYNFDSGEGLIRHVVVRVSFKADEVMVIVVANGDVMPELEKLVSILCNKVPEVKSIYLNINREKTNQILGSECMLIYGEETINDFIGELRFDISPLSFF